MRPHRQLLLIAVPIFYTLLCFSQETTVALTFDDLPAVGTRDASEIRAINLAILDALDRHHAPATAFVIAGNADLTAQSRPMLQEWKRRGYALGNHTFTHASFSDLTLAQEEDEILRADTALAPFFAPGPRYLRFPYNAAGETAEKHTAILTFLHLHGYQVATCTIDNSDYEFANAYSLMLGRDDTANASRLRKEYLDYTAAEIAFYTNLHKTLFGHEIPHVMLLHASRLNADTIEQILKLFETRHYQFVSLSSAQADPAYAVPDTYATKYGPMWAFRWSQELGIKVDGAAETAPPTWISRYGK